MELRELADEFIVPKLGPVPPPTAVRALRYAWHVFAERTLTHKVLEPLVSVSGQQEYTIGGTLPTDTRIFQIQHVYNAVDVLEPIAQHTIIQKFSSPTLSGDPAYYYREGTTMGLFRIPDKVETFTVDMRVVPVLNASVIPDDYINEYHLAIVAGAVANLAIMENEWWASGMHAQESAATFSEAISHYDGRADHFDQYRVRTTGYGGI